MLRVVAKSVLFGVAITVVAVTFVVGQVKKPPDPLAEWAYPKAKQEMGETWERPLPWAVFTTTDPFEKVWEFYWQKKITNWGMPIKPQAGASLHTAITSPKGQESISFTYVYDPKGKTGVLVIRREKATTHITITQQGKQTKIVVIMDMR